MTNCNHKHGQMLTCRHDVDMFTLGRIVLSSPKRAHVDWNWLISRKKKSKNRLVCKNAVALAYYGSCRLLVMGSWYLGLKAVDALLKSYVLMVADQLRTSQGSH